MNKYVQGFIKEFKRVHCLPLMATSAESTSTDFVKPLIRLNGSHSKLPSAEHRFWYTDTRRSDPWNKKLKQTVEGETKTCVHGPLSCRPAFRTAFSAVIWATPWNPTQDGTQMVTSFRLNVISSKTHNTASLAKAACLPTELCCVHSAPPAGSKLKSVFLKVRHALGPHLYMLCLLTLQAHYHLLIDGCNNKKPRMSKFKQQCDYTWQKTIILLN